MVGVVEEVCEKFRESLFWLDGVALLRGARFSPIKERVPSHNGDDVKVFGGRE